MRTIRTCAALALSGALLSVTSVASAYCLTTTCDPNAEDCGLDADECATRGLRLYWPVACTSYNLSVDATPGITYDAFAEAAAAAYAAWTSVDCGGGQGPSIQVKDLGPVQGGAACYNQRNGNTNVVFFQSKTWPYPGGDKTIALTTVTFNTETGEIYDADMEINSAHMKITVGDEDVENDLQSVITHEAGHFFGLAHAGGGLNKSSTMYETYAAKSISLRTLEEDDAAGMCALYPVGRNAAECDPTPRHGFGTTCGDPPVEEGGCNMGRGGAGAAWLLIVLGIGLRKLRIRK